MVASWPCGPFWIGHHFRFHFVHCIADIRCSMGPYSNGFNGWPGGLMSSLWHVSLRDAQRPYSTICASSGQGRPPPPPTCPRFPRINSILLSCAPLRRFRTHIRPQSLTPLATNSKSTIRNWSLRRPHVQRLASLVGPRTLCVEAAQVWEPHRLYCAVNTYL